MTRPTPFCAFRRSPKLSVVIFRSAGPSYAPCHAGSRKIVELPYAREWARSSPSGGGGDRSAFDAIEEGLLRSGGIDYQPLSFGGDPECTSPQVSCLPRPIALLAKLALRRREPATANDPEQKAKWRLT